MYWIWSLLDSDERLLVTWVSPPIFGLQHCCRFRKRMQLNMGGLRLNTLFSTCFSIIFFFTSFSFSSISLHSGVYISFFSILSFSIISFNVCWSFFACLGVINFNFISCPSCLKWRERSSRLSVLKWSHVHLNRRWQEFEGAISHNSSFTHCHALNLILARFGWKVVGNLSFSTNLWLTTLLSLSETNASKQGWPSIKHLVLYFLFHNLFLYFLFFFFNFPSFWSLYFFFFNSFFFYYLLQRMLILLRLSWCHKFQLHFMSLMPQTKGTFIKIKPFKMKPCHPKGW